MGQNFFEYQPTMDLNLFLRQYGKSYVSNTLPAPPNGTVNVTWQTDSEGHLSANVPDNIGGGVNPGTATQIGYYQSNGSAISPSNITIDAATGNNLTVPSLAKTGTLLSSSIFTQVSGLASSIPAPPSWTPGGLEFAQVGLNSTVLGSGWSFGNIGGWTVAANVNSEFISMQRGIHQDVSLITAKRAVGDTAGIYMYTFSDGGVSATSDEGVTGITCQVYEGSQNGGYFHGTVSSTSGTGDINPVLAFTSGNAWTTDGAFLLNISKGSISGNLTGFGNVAVNLTTNLGSQATYLNSLPVSNTLPKSTAIGVVTSAITPPITTADSPQIMTVTTRICEINSSFPLFTVGSIVTVGGRNYPEQSKIITAVNNGDGTQTLTLKLRNPQTVDSVVGLSAIIFQGGIQGQYISFDQNIAFSGMRSSYYAYGSLTGSDLIYYVNVAGGEISGVQLPQIGSEAATTTGGYHLYPGAEVVKNATTGFVCTLEQNGVAWATNDVVENPHYPVGGGGALNILKSQQTPTNPSFGSVVASFVGFGPGFGNGSSIVSVTNGVPSASYTPQGGPLGPPRALNLSGTFQNLMYATLAPSESMFRVQNFGYSGQTSIQVFEFDTIGGGNMYVGTGGWSVSGSFNAQSGFAANNLNGVSGTYTFGTHTVTITGGIITNVT